MSIYYYRASNYYIPVMGPPPQLYQRFYFSKTKKDYANGPFYKEATYRPRNQKCLCSCPSAVEPMQTIYQLRLEDSLERVEKASDRLRMRSRGMYRRLRDTIHKAELSY